MGAILCDEPTCNVITRPQTRCAKVPEQLEQSCLCGGKLQYKDSCSATSTLYSFRDGVFFVHRGTHDHPRPTHKLHLTGRERAHFEDIIASHPKVKPSQLLTGVAGLTGPEDSVAEISSVLVNVDRIKAELRRMRETTAGDFEDEFAKFQAGHPGFIVFSQFGAVSVVVMQTPFMSSMLVKHLDDEEAVNGIVSDAAHGFWRESKHLLIFSSAFSTVLQHWVPGLMTYANGATEEHYRLHFLVLFESMAEECERRSIEVKDEIFANVCAFNSWISRLVIDSNIKVVDFSEAERGGFTAAFIDFWQNPSCDDSRSEEDLRQGAAALLKGCQQHFRSQVTRVSKISAAVPPNQRDHFKDRVLALQDAITKEDFHRIANAFYVTSP
ncbi:hypothetical protein BU15DRAFT_49826 [Melanogaster broomeanus]|nr:hypothetical protein BU15DRAFT_49826 [Melanogaster broomeanus]